MKQLFDKPGRLWRTLTLGLGLIGLAGGLWLGPGPAVSWAASGLQPDQQTIPTRPPTPDPTSTSAPQPEDDDDDEVAIPTRLPTGPATGGQAELPPPQPPARTTGAAPDNNVPPEPSAEPDVGADQDETSTGPTAQRLVEVEEDRGADRLQPVEPERRVTAERAVVEADEERLRPESEAGPAEESSSLTCLYALLLGGLLILVGIYLVNRARRSELP